MPKRVIFDKKNILVTGGAGFIGSHLCDRLVKDNKVICLDNFITGDERNIDHLLANENFVFIKQDINQPLDLENLPDVQKFKVEFQGIQEIYHLACPTSPADFEANKINTLLVNSIGMKNILDLAVKYKAKLAHFSSSVVYGSRREEGKKIKENDWGRVNPTDQRSCYDEGKRFAETMVVNYRDAYNLDVRIPRIFRTYGPRMKLNDQQMLPDFIVNGLDNKDLVIYGDKNFISSFCYVDDVIDAVLKLAESDVSEPVNIGSDTEEKLATMAEKIIALTKSSSKIIYKEPIIFMSPLAVPDITMAKEKLNWMPITTLDKGLEKTVEDLRASKGLIGVKQVM